MAHREKRIKRVLIAAGAGLLANTIIAAGCSMLFIDPPDRLLATLVGVPMIYGLQALIAFRGILQTAIHSIYLLPARSEEFHDELSNRGMPFGPSFSRLNAREYFSSIMKTDEVEPTDQFFASEMIGYMDGAAKFGRIRALPTLGAINTAVRRYVAE